MKIRSDAVVSVILVLCAILTTGLVVRQQFFASPTGSSVSSNSKPIFRADWRSYTKLGRVIGSPAARVSIIEFSDFECPFCAQFHKDYRDLQRKYGADLSLTFVHLPLSMHRFSTPAARVSECANRQGRFPEMVSQLFEGQQKFGLKSWADFGRAAGIPDQGAFDECVADEAPMPIVERGQKLAAHLGITATPTLILNGWQMPPMSKAELDTTIADLLAGRPPRKTGE